jgi:uncharacterized membrane protein
VNLRRPLLLAGVLILAAAMVGVWAYRLLPAGGTIAVHFNGQGAPDGLMPKGIGLAFAPIMGAIVLLGLAFAPRLARDQAALAQNAGAYGIVLIGAAAVFLVVEAALAVRAMDPTFDVLRWIFLAIAVFFVVLGALVGRVRQNRIIGIRTPWTLKDEGVWNRTQRFTGRLTVLGGVALAAVAFVGADHIDLIVALVICGVGPALAGAVYSRAIYREPAKDA